MGQSLPAAQPLTHSQRAAFLSRPIERKRHKTWLNLGALGDEVEARAEYLIQIDDDGYLYVELVAVRLQGGPFHGRFDAYGYLPDSVDHDIEEEIKEVEGLE